MRSFPLLRRSHSWAALSLLSLFALSLPCAAQYPGGGYPGGGSGGGYPGSSGSWVPCDANGSPLPSGSPGLNSDGSAVLLGSGKLLTVDNTYPIPKSGADSWWYTAYSTQGGGSGGYPGGGGGYPGGGYPGGGGGYPGGGSSSSGLSTSSAANNSAYNPSAGQIGYYDPIYCSNDRPTSTPVPPDLTGHVTTSGSDTLTAYFVWTGPGPVPSPATFLVRASVSAGSSVSYGSSGKTGGLSATATAALGGDTVTATAGDAGSLGSQTEGTSQAQQVTPVGSLATVSLTGNVSSKSVNGLHFGSWHGSYYYVDAANGDAGPTWANANASAAGTASPFAASLQAARTGGALSIRPAYFSGTACPAQAVAPALGGTVAHAQLLVDGLPIREYWDVGNSPPNPLPAYGFTGTGQTSVTLTATFDALNYAEGYLLPVRLKVWDSAGGFYSVTLSAPVHLPQLAPYDIWTNDYNPELTNNPAPVSGSASGAVGGSTALHLRLLYPPSPSGTTLTSLRLHFHADPDASRDTVWSNQAMTAPAQTSAGPPPTYSLWSSLCQDPDPGQAAAPPAVYLEQPWTIGGRNGSYDVTATLSVPGAGGAVHTFTQATTFDREDLLIADGGTYPMNPKPILWDPDQPDPLGGAVGGRALLVSYGAAYKAFKLVAVRIYSSDQTLVRTLTDYDQGWSAQGQWSFYWDGRGEPVNGQPGALLPRGVYLFQWSVADTLGVTDSDKSNFLSITSPPAVTALSDDGTTAIYQVKYSLVSDDAPARSAAGGSIDVFDPNLSKILSQQLKPTELLSDAHTVDISTPTPKLAGSYVFLVSPQDNDADQDRGQRSRYALQHNNRGEDPGVIAWAFGGLNALEQDMSRQAESFFKGMQSMGYNELASPYHDWYHDPVLADVKGPLEKGFSDADNYPLAIASITGHGSIDGRVLQIANQRGHNKFLTTQGAYDNTSFFPNPGATDAHTHYTINSAALAQDHILIENINGTNPIQGHRLAYLKMVLLSGCDMNYGQHHGVVAAIWDSGVQCLVVLGQHHLPHSACMVFLNGDGAGRGFLQCLKAGETIAQAVDEANKTVNNKYPSVTNGTRNGIFAFRTVNPGYDQQGADDPERGGTTQDFEALCYTRSGASYTLNRR